MKDYFARVMLVITVLAYTGACRSVESVTLTCPPGMTRAAKQPICIHGHCGDGLPDAEEACDDGNRIDGDGCSAECRSTESCGNAIIDLAVGEVCDDGNGESGDECCGDCRSCPELAMLPPDADSEPNAEKTGPEVLPCPATDSEVAMLGAGSAAQEWLAPLQLTSIAPAPLVDAAALVATREVPSSRNMEALEQARAAARLAQQKAKSEAKEREHLADALKLMSERLAQAQAIIDQNEQAKANLQQFIDAECQRLASGRTEELQ